MKLLRMSKQRPHDVRVVFVYRSKVILITGCSPFPKVLQTAGGYGVAQRQGR